MKDYGGIPILLGLLLLVLTFLGFLASATGRNTVINPVKDRAAIRLRSLGPGCAGCHVRIFLELDGPAASALSKGVHPIRRESLEHPYFELHSEQCQGCHEQTHRSWQSSAHGRSFTNPIFQHAFQRDQKAWCLNCHAPLWQPDRMDPVRIAREPDLQALYAEGINCVSCHVRDGQIVGPNDLSYKAEELFHPVRHDPGLKSEDFCAGCHQFNFVQSLEPFAVYENEHPMQNTVAEFKRYRRAHEETGTDSCVACHFKDKGHDLKSGAEPDLSRKIELSIESETVWENRPSDFGPPSGELPRGPSARSQARPLAGRIRIRWHVNIPQIAHHFPTGDLFRILSLYAYDSGGKEIFRYDFRKEVRVLDRHVLKDTTLKPKPGKTNAEGTVEAFLESIPARCEMVYRLQGNIEPRIAPHFEPGILRKVLYSGPCNRAFNDFSSAVVSDNQGVSPL
ncbi:MAG: hypothetical protein KDK25_14545 [Leptospiraceae bacterium]|nr:hypothetical protein [Leptospiraceae bacterium]